MLSFSSHARNIFPRFLGTASRAPSLRWSSSALDRHDFLYPPSSTNPSSRPPPPSTHIPPPSFSSSSQALPQKPFQRRNLRFSYALRDPQLPNDLLPGNLTSLSLLEFLRDRKTAHPSSPPLVPSAHIREVLDGRRGIQVTGSREEAEEIVELLMKPAKSLKEGVEIAQWILRVTELDRGAAETRTLVSLVVYDLVAGLTSRIRPPPHPEDILRFLLSNARRVYAPGIFSRERTPLVALLEVYSLSYRQDLDKASSSSGPPTHASRSKADAARVRYLTVVRSIHQVMQEVEKDITTIRGSNALMIAHNQAEEYEEGEEIWRAMRSEGGVGIDQESVTGFFEGCGYSGNLPQALSTWKELRATTANLTDENYEAYQDCLNRMGAWDDLFDFFADQAHALYGSTALSIQPRAIASALVSALRLVNNPHLRTLHAPDANAYYRLEVRLQLLVGKATWDEVGRLLKTGEYWVPETSEY